MPGPPASATRARPEPVGESSRRWPNRPRKSSRRSGNSTALLAESVEHKHALDVDQPPPRHPSVARGRSHYGVSMAVRAGSPTRVAHGFGLITRPGAFIMNRPGSAADAVAVPVVGDPGV